jgi:hypothetical protein
MSVRKPYSELNLPSHHLPPDGNDAQPASARRQDEIDFRRSRRQGALVRDQERKGLVIADRMLPSIARGEIDDGGFVVRMLALAGVNTAFYDFARGAKVMDRKLELAKLVQDEGADEQPVTQQSLLEKAQSGMELSVNHATRLYELYIRGREGKRLNVNLGRTLGNTSLVLGSLDLPGRVQDMDAFEAQEVARDHSLLLLEDARTIATKADGNRNPMGSHPSMMQLADPDSDLNVYWRRYGSNDAVELLEASTTEPIPPANELSR